MKWMRDGFPIRGVDTDAEGRFAIPAVLGFPATFEVVDISLCEWKTFIITKPGSVTLEMTKP